MSETDGNRRGRFRLKFPLGEQPCLSTHGVDYAVVELAEDSARIIATGALLRIGKSLDAVFTLQTGQQITTRIEPTRVEGKDMIVTLHPPVPQKEIMAEQRRLLIKYGKEGLRDI